MISGRGNDDENGSGSAPKQRNFHGVILEKALWIFAVLFVICACCRATGDLTRDANQVLQLLQNSSIEVEVSNVTTILRQTGVRLVREGHVLRGPITINRERSRAIEVIAEVHRYFSSLYTNSTETRPMWRISNDFLETLAIVRAHAVMDIMQPLTDFTELINFMRQRLRFGLVANSNDDNVGNDVPAITQAPHSRDSSLMDRRQRSRRNFLSLDQILKMFRLNSRYLLSGISFMSYDLLPVSPLPTDANRTDPNLDHRLSAAINQWFNSRHFTDLLLARCKDLGVRRCAIEKAETGELHLINRGNTIQAGTHLNLCTGLIVNSYELEGDKRKSSDGVASNRKFNVTITIQEVNGTYGNVLSIIQIGWPQEYICYVNKDICAGGEFCDHSCEPNCEIETDDQAIESYKIQLDGKIYKVSYKPIFIVCTKEVKHNERPTVSYGNACVKQASPRAPEFREQQQLIQQSLQSSGKRKVDMQKTLKDTLTRHFTGRRLTIDRKRIEKENPGENELAILCKCSYCDEALEMCRKERSLLLMGVKGGIDYEKLRNIHFPSPSRPPIRIRGSSFFQTREQRQLGQKIEKGKISFRQAIEASSSDVVKNQARNFKRRANYKLKKKKNTKDEPTIDDLLAIYYPVMYGAFRGESGASNAHTAGAIYAQAVTASQARAVAARRARTVTASHAGAVAARRASTAGANEPGTAGAARTAGERHAHAVAARQARIADDDFGSIGRVVSAEEMRIYNDPTSEPYSPDEHDRPTSPDENA
jgi:hypothetical protein